MEGYLSMDLRTKLRFLLGGALSATYAALYYFALNSAEPMSALFVDGINTMLAIYFRDVAELEHGSLIKFPMNLCLGIIEWFVVGAYVLPALWKIFVMLFFRTKREPHKPTKAR